MEEEDERGLAVCLMRVAWLGCVIWVKLKQRGNALAYLRLLRKTEVEDEREEREERGHLV